MMVLPNVDFRMFFLPANIAACYEIRMDVDEFIGILRETGAYTTPERKLGLFDRMDWWFYLRLAGHIHDCRDGFVRDFNLDTWKYHSHRIFKLVETAGGRVHAEGIHNLGKAKPPYVYISNHMSLVETFLLPVLMLDTSDVCIVLKENLMKYPCFGELLEVLDPIVVTRRNAREDLKVMFEQGKEALKKGRSVLIFPQSTRSTRVSPADFNSVGVKLAQRENVPCVPIALKTDFLRPGRLIRDIGPIDRSKAIHFKFGEPIKVTKENARQAHGQIISFITDALKNWE